VLSRIHLTEARQILQPPGEKAATHARSGVSNYRKLTLLPEREHSAYRMHIVNMLYEWVMHGRFAGHPELS